MNHSTLKAKERTPLSEWMAGNKSGKDTIAERGIAYAHNYWLSKFRTLDSFDDCKVVAYWLGYGRAVAEHPDARL